LCARVHICGGIVFEMGENVCVMSICVFVVLIGLVDVLLCFIDSRVRKIRNEASSCPGIFSRTLRFYYVAQASSPGSLCVRAGGYLEAMGPFGEPGPFEPPLLRLWRARGPAMQDFCCLCRIYFFP